MRTNLVFAMLGCAVAMTVGGCMAPRYAPIADGQKTQTSGINSPAILAGEKLAATSQNIDATPSPIAKNTVTGANSDMTGVLDKLLQVRAIDPAAEQKLLEELQRTPSDSWPLVAEQFRASLAYRQQLTNKSRQARDSAASAQSSHGAGEGEDPAEPRLSRRPQAAQSPPSTDRLASLPDRPSAPIGGLVDPRQADVADMPSESLALSIPYSAPPAVDVIEPSDTAAVAPAAFTSDSPAYPIAKKTVVATDGTPREVDTAVMQARLEVVTKDTSAAESKDADVDWQQSVKSAIDELSSRVAGSPSTTAEVHQQVSLRMLWLLAGDTAKALEPIPHIPPAEQDYWSRQMFALATYLDHHSQPDDKRRAAASVTHLDEAVAHLREVGSLSVRNLSFCKNVHGYGAIEPYDADRFSSGEQVSLYVEVENYHSESTEKGFCTLLGSTYELLDEQGERVSGGEFPDVDDCCRSRRRDFHIQYGLTLPEKMPAGKYRLQLVVKDRQSDKIGSASATFEIRGNRP